MALLRSPQLPPPLRARRESKYRKTQPLPAKAGRFCCGLKVRLRLKPPEDSPAQSRLKTFLKLLAMGRAYSPFFSFLPPSANLTRLPEAYMAFRVEKDPLDQVSVRAEGLWGAQTQRAIRNLPTSGLK